MFMIDAHLLFARRYLNFLQYIDEHHDKFGFKNLFEWNLKESQEETSFGSYFIHVSKSTEKTLRIRVPENSPQQFGCF